MFELHFEPICYWPQEIGVHVLEKINSTYACTPSWHTHAHHVHTHATMYAKVYACTHCNRKSHLAKFCFGRLNILNFVTKIVWDPIATNPHGPKRKIWVPKSLPLAFDVGVASHKMWEDWCLCTRCNQSLMGISWMHSYQGVLVGGPPYFWRYRLATSIMLTISYSTFKMFGLKKRTNTWGPKKV